MNYNYIVITFNILFFNFLNKFVISEAIHVSMFR